MADAEDVPFDAPIDVTDGMPRDTHKITWNSLWLIFVTGFLILLDFGLDICLAIEYHDHAKDKTEKYFILTLAFLVIPSVMMTVQSLVGYYRDVRSHVYPKISVLRWIALSIFHLLQLGPIWRCGETLILGDRLMRESKRKELNRIKRRELEEHYNRAHYRLISLKLLESFLEGCPQLVLQTYILIDKYGSSNTPSTATSTTTSTTLSTTPSTTISPSTSTSHDHGNNVELIISCVKIGLSLVSVSKAMMSYYEKKRLDESHRRVLHGAGIVLQFFWYLFTLLSRVVALAALAVLLEPLQFSFCISVHWLLMVVWIQHDKQKSYFENDDRSNVEANVLYNIAIGGLYVFNFVKEVNTPMKWRYVIYYSIVFCEGVTIMVLWYLYADPNDHESIILLSIFFGSFPLGITFMIIHYKRHPSVMHRANPFRIVVQSDSKSSADYNGKTAIELREQYRVKLNSIKE